MLSTDMSKKRSSRLRCRVVRYKRRLPRVPWTRCKTATVDSPTLDTLSPAVLNENLFAGNREKDAHDVS